MAGPGCRPKMLPSTHLDVAAPVIACPPYSEKFGGADLFSSLRMPSGVAPAVVLDPAGAAQLAAKILAVGDADLRASIVEAQRAQTEGVIAADVERTGQK